MPTTQFSRSLTLTRRNVPALCGMSGSMRVEDAGHAVVHGARARLVDAGREAVDVVGEVDLDHARVRVDRDRDVDRDPVGGRPERIVAPVADDRARRHLRDDVRDAALGVVEPLPDELRRASPLPYFAHRSFRRASPIRAAPTLAR